jgi:hypothetical protein
MTLQGIFESTMNKHLKQMPLGTQLRFDRELALDALSVEAIAPVLTYKTMHTGKSVAARAVVDSHTLHAMPKHILPETLAAISKKLDHQLRAQMATMDPLQWYSTNYDVTTGGSSATCSYTVATDTANYIAFDYQQKAYQGYLFQQQQQALQQQVLRPEKWPDPHIPADRPAGIALTPGCGPVSLPDGAEIRIDEKGNYKIHDKDAKVIYKANRSREFNPFVNAGDRIAEFIEYVRREVPAIQGSDISQLPLELFVNWLILEAAEKDGDEAPPDVVPVPNSRLLVDRINPRCRYPKCGRFIKRASVDVGFNYCNPQHAEQHVLLLKAA